MKVAIVGCGGMGNVHASAYASMPEIEIAGVCDIILPRAEELAARVGAPAFPTFEAMMAAVQPEAVSLTLPSYLHREYIEKAAALGVHVISEKPISLTLEDAEAAVKCCDMHGVRLFVGHVVRFFPEYASLKNSIDTGRIGKPAVAHLRRVGGFPQQPWFKDEALSGGVIADLVIHDIDFVLWALGEAKSVYCMRRIADGMDYALVTIIFASGAVANLEGYWGYPSSFRTAAEFSGTGGVVRLDSTATQSLQMRKLQSSASGSVYAEVPQSPSMRDPYTLELEHFIACIREGREPIVTAADACQALRIANAARESALTGQAILL